MPDRPTIDAQFVDLSAQPTAAVRVRRPMSTVDVGALMDDAMSRLGALLGQTGATPVGPPYARYHAWGGELADVEIGFPLARKIDGLLALADSPEGEVGASELPGGHAARTVHRGPYPTLGDAYGSLHDWIHSQGLRRGRWPVGVLHRQPGRGRRRRTAQDGDHLARAGPVTAAVESAAHPIVIGHRGASGYRPEHTLASYELAIEQGADFIEPDLVATKDGVLVARHENEIGGTTDVAAHPEFADRRTTRVIDGAPLTGWFTEDFTLDELRTLRARERLPEVRPGSAAFDGQFAIPTLEDIVDLARRAGERRGHMVGLYPETKHPTYFRSIGLPLEEPLVATLHAAGYQADDASVFIQSFEADSLRRLAGLTSLRLVQLLTAGPQAAERTDAQALAEVAGYARAIGADKDLVIPRDGAGNLLNESSLVADAHAAGLLVHAWTFRAEKTFLAANIPDAGAEYAVFYATGLDGVFTDQPDLAVAARARSSR
jgi:glycerophosphoryl diester phosphodiesterase